MSLLFWPDDPYYKPTRRQKPPIPDTGWRTPEYLPNLSAARAIGLDVEAYDPELKEHGPGWARGKSHLVGISVSTEDGYAWYLPIRHTIEAHCNLNPDQVLAWARHELGRKHQPKIGTNLIYDVGTLAAEGVHVVGDLHDVSYAEALLDERASVSLEAIAQKYLNTGKVSNLLYQWCADFYGGDPDDTQRANIYRTPPRLCGPYAESDARLPFRALPVMYAALRAQGLADLYRVECGLIPLLVKMRFAGVSVNLTAAERLREDLLVAEKEARAKLAYIAGVDCNPNSAHDLAALFTRLGLPIVRTPAGAPSFDKDVLKACKHPVAAIVSDVRRLEKLRTTFVEGYVLGANVGGKLFCQFNPLRKDDGGTRSGRFSSSDPNLQNIPIRDEIWGPKIRGLFTPDLGHVAWRKYDYSQIEYRVLIHFAVGTGAEEARAHFRAHPDTDYHDWALDLVAPHAGWIVNTKELRKKWRRPLKNINFGLVFGMGEEHLAESIGLSLREAQAVFSAYHAGVPFAKPTMRYYSNLVQAHGYVATILGRRSRYDLWEPAGYDRDPKMIPLPYSAALATYGSNIVRAFGYTGLNRELQGTAADILKTAMFRCWNEGVYDYIGVPRLIVHDEKDFSDPGGKDDGFLYMKHVMENAIPLSIPVRADLDIGPDWGNVKAA